MPKKQTARNAWHNEAHTCAVMRARFLLAIADRFRKYVRNFVDSRISVGEFFLPFIFLVLLVSITRNRTIAVLSILAMYLIMFVAIIDGWIMGRKIKKLVAAKFPNESTKGLALYGFLRSTQMRRMRAPKPNVKRGEKNF
jgi:general stress protein CsbA